MGGRGPRGRRRGGVPDRLSPMPHEPFFIVGFQRSGTTLLRMMLDSHPEVAVPLDVVGLWADYEDRLAEYGDLSSQDDVRRLVRDLVAEERIRLWEADLDEPAVLSQLDGARYPDVIAAFYRAYARSRGKSRWGDKDPGNMTRLDRVLAWFPDARILHIIRDGRDACLSQLRQSFGFDEVLPCAEAWREQVSWVSRIGRILGRERYHELRYEDLVEDPADVLRMVCGFLELDYRDEMLRYHERVEEGVPDSKRHIWTLIDQPVRRSAAGRWRSEMSRPLRICFEKRAGEVLRRQGYDVLPQASGAYVEELRRLLGSAWRAARRRLGRG